MDLKLTHYHPLQTAPVFRKSRLLAVLLVLLRYSPNKFL